MYANTGYSTSWVYSNENDHSVDHYSSPSLASDSDSAQELLDLEELLYSHIHYEPNYLCMTGTPTDYSCSDVHITQLRDEVSDGVNISSSASPATCNITDSEVVIIDVIPPKDEVSSSTISSSLSKQRKRNPESCKTSQSADVIKTKSNKVDTLGSSSSIVLESTPEASSKEVCRLDGQHQAKKKKLKVKQKTRITGGVAAAEAAKPVVVDSSESESASDVFCCDLSSDEVSSDGADDIKLSNINHDLPNTSDVAALTDVLNSLPDCNWDVNAQDRAAGTLNISRYYTPTTTRARCINCNERGHLARDCTMPKKLLACILCGVRGHVARSCPGSLCFNCHQPGHAVRDCDQRRRVRSEICRRCGMRGHIQMECPDLWRQYHLTITPGHIETSKLEKVERKFCYNCGASGHFGHECDKDRMDSFSLPTLPFIARYDSHSAAKSPSTPRHKKCYTNTDTREHKEDSRSSRDRQRTPDEKRCNRNMQSLCVMSHPLQSNSSHDFLNIHGKTDLSSQSSHHVLAFNKREYKDKRNDSASRQKDSFGSKHKRHLSTDVTNSRFKDRIASKQLVSPGHSHKSVHRRSNSVIMGTKQLASDAKVFEDNLSNSTSKQKMNKKSRLIESLPHDTWQQQNARKAIRGLLKTPIDRKSFISGSAKHMKKTPPSTVKHNESRNKIASYGDNLLGKDRKVIRTARGFLMTVDIH